MGEEGGGQRERQHRCSRPPGVIHVPEQLSPCACPVCILSPENTSINKTEEIQASHTRVRGCDDPQANTLTFPSNFQVCRPHPPTPTPGSNPIPSPWAPRTVLPS